MIPYGRQSISDEDVDAVTKVLRSDFLTQGPAVPEFEQRIADLTAAKHSIAVSSATSALHIAYLALDLGPGDVLWTSPNTFVATSNAALLCGASVDFVDIDPVTLNMSPVALEEKLRRTKSTGGKLPKIVAPVHFAGEPCDMSAIGALAGDYGFKVVEDAAHAIGATYGNKPVGACEHSSACIFSFHPVKIVTTGEGGLVTTQDDALASRMNRLRSHGITREPGEMVGPSDGPWYYQQVELGLNYRMTDFQAALGTSQLTRLDRFLKQRHILADRYDAAFDKMGIQHSRRAAGRYSALHLYVIRWPDKAAIGRLEAFKRMREAGIGVNVHYIPVHTQPYYASLGFTPDICPAALDYYRQAITLPLHPQLTDEQQEFVIGTVKKLVAGA
jgi:UDP-4-amino-4,6-dideoxy-N-acetyl-beta-L-altrosamine transaminase